MRQRFTDASLKQWWSGSERERLCTRRPVVAVVSASGANASTLAGAWQRSTSAAAKKITRGPLGIDWVYNHVHRKPKTLHVSLERDIVHPKRESYH